MRGPLLCRRSSRASLAGLLLIVSCTPRENEPDKGQADQGRLEAGADSVARGRYLVEFGGCHDCHTPKVFTARGPERDLSRALSGHPAGSKVPPVPRNVLGPKGWGALTTPDLTAWAGPWGVSFSANLTPDPSGLGTWTVEQFIQTIRTGKHLGVGRDILPPMPWYDVAKLTDDDLRAVFAYLRTLKPVQNAVPAPIAPGTAR